MTAQSDDFTDILYKYTDLNGAQKTLTTGKLRFTRPSELNDPFDVRIDEWMAMEHEPFFRAAWPLVAERMLSCPEVFAKLTGMALQHAEDIVKSFLNQSESEKAVMVAEITNITGAEAGAYMAKARRSTELTRTLFAAAFDTYGLFCATRTFSNLLMWAHYADKHRGAVLGFRADLEKDSMLRLMRPVRYSDQRPHAIDTVEEFMAGLDIPGNQMARKIADKLFHTKSAEWAYEQECRLFMPDGVRDGETAGYFPFLPKEFEEVYLGYRMTDDNKAEITRLAKAVNSDVRIFAATLAKRKYALEFDPVP